MSELHEKTERLTRLAADTGLSGILLTTQHNFAWATGGRTNRIDGSREPGAGALLVTGTGRRALLASTIEMPRLLDEEVGDLGLEPVEFPWADDRADPALVPTLARRLTGSGLPLGADWPVPGAAMIEGQIARARSLLVSAEIARYRTLGAQAGEAVGDACRRLTPGLSEQEVARRVTHALLGIGARPIVLLVGADDRIARYRHPVPTATPWHRTVLVATCAQREGLVVALSRIVATAPVPPALVEGTDAAARVFGRIVSAARPGARGREIFDAAVRAYADAGVPGEERQHHQGGAIGYRSREWVAHPNSDDVVQGRQAFAWNPSITGTKVEETTLVNEDAVEVLTASPGWPAIPFEVHGRRLDAPGVLGL